ncbi:hypothetical protein EMIT0P171_220041 [Pseudomonas sp. IT-P171]|jgi:hypothetical protein
MTVGPGITPGLLTLSPVTAKAVLSPSARGLCALRAITAGGELHPALRTFCRQIVWRRSVFNTYFAPVHCGYLMIVIDFFTRLSGLFLAQGLIIRRQGRSNSPLNGIFPCLPRPDS